MNITRDFRSDLLKRRELNFVLESEGNPSFAFCAKTVAEKFKVAEDVVVVKKILGQFGRKTFLVESFIYDSVKDKEINEPKKKIKKEAAK